MSPVIRWPAGGILHGNPEKDTLTRVAGAQSRRGEVGNEVPGKCSLRHGGQ